MKKIRQLLFVTVCFITFSAQANAAELCELELYFPQNQQQQIYSAQGLTGDIPFISLRDFSACTGKYVHWFSDTGAIGWITGQRIVIAHPQSNTIYLIDCGPVYEEIPTESSPVTPEEAVPDEDLVDDLVGIPVPDDAMHYVENELVEITTDEEEKQENSAVEETLSEKESQPKANPKIVAWNYTVKKEKLATPITTYQQQTYIHMTMLPYLGYEGSWQEPQQQYVIEKTSYGELAGISLQEGYQQVKAEIKKEIAPKEKVLGSYKTSFNPNEKNRTINLKLAAAAINGQIIQPGKSFSFNKVVGPRTKERGYLKATIFVNGKKEQGYGGGICQVSSTLYNAVLKAKLKVLERHTHSLPVTYVPTGKDATVSYGWLDFRFQNNYQIPVKIQVNVSKNTLEIKFIALAS